jgi:hypothetical protein
MKWGKRLLCWFLGHQLYWAEEDNVRCFRCKKITGQVQRT